MPAGRFGWSCAAASSFPTGRRSPRQAVKASLERSIRAVAGSESRRLRVDRRSLGATSRKNLRTSPGSVPASRDRIDIRLDRGPSDLSGIPDGRADLRGGRRPGRGEAGTAASGTGPFQIAEQPPQRVVLERNPQYWKDTPHAARRDRVSRRRFRPRRSPRASSPESSIWPATSSRATSKRSLREPRFRPGLVETPEEEHLLRALQRRQRRGGQCRCSGRRHGPRREDAGLRLGARSGASRSPRRDFCLPESSATTPAAGRPTPSGRRRSRRSAPAGCLFRCALTAAVHPILLDQYGALTKALFQIWAEVGVEVSAATKTMAEYLGSWQGGSGADLWIGRWIADYDDPDNFTFTLFHSGNGRLRSLLLLAGSRPHSRAGPDGEPAGRARRALYRQFREPRSRLSGDRSPLPRRGLPHREPQRPGLAASPRPLPTPTTPRSGRSEARGSLRGSRQAGRRRTSATLPIAGVVRSLDPALYGDGRAGRRSCPAFSRR